MKILSNSLSSWLQILIRCRHVTSCKFFLFITNSVFDLQSTDFNLWSLNSEIVFLRKIWEMLSSLSRVGLSSSKWGSKAVSINHWHNVFLEKTWLWLFRILNVSLDFHYLFVATKATFLRDNVLTHPKIGFVSNLPSLLAYSCSNQIRLVQFRNVILTVHICIYNCYITIIEDTELAKKQLGNKGSFAGPMILLMN